MIMEVPDPAPHAREQLPISLFEGVVLSIRRDDGAIALDFRDLCATMTLDADAQRRRIAVSEDVTLTAFRVRVGAQLRRREFLPLDDLSVWILSLQTRRMSPVQRERIRYVKDYLKESVRAAFAQLVGLPEVSTAIEDLRDLDRLSDAFTAIGELTARQETLEASQERARAVYRDLAAELRLLRERVQAMERAVKEPITAPQRGTIFHMVQTWAAARAAHGEAGAIGTILQRCWREVNAVAKVAAYKDIPTARYNDVVRYLQTQYQALTGTPLPAIEQHGFGDEA